MPILVLLYSIPCIRWADFQSKNLNHIDIYNSGTCSLVASPAPVALFFVSEWYRYIFYTPYI